ncbi:MAG TPA: SurA N-terminal domain-containing protein [bacterium]|nr:SurA N-terminal domain-containing protein [bacterium]
MDNETNLTELLMDTEAQTLEKHLEEPLEVKPPKKKINRKTLLILGAIIVVLVLAYVFVYRKIFIVATVDGSPISRLTIIKKLEKASGKALLDSLINEKLVNNEAIAQNIVVTDEEVETIIKTIETQVSTQGSTLEAELALQGMNREDFKQQIIFQKQVEKLVADKTVVTDEEVNKYITDNEVEIPAGQETLAQTQIKNELMNQKINQAAVELLSDLKTKAKINYLIKY